MPSIVSGNFTFTDTSIEGVKVIDVKSYGDHRGYFMETYKRPDFVAGGIDCEFVQDNQSSSTKGVLRGMHFQINHPQSKLVRVVKGAVFDVCVDLRPGSPTWGQWEGCVLSAENRRPSSAVSVTTSTTPTTRVASCGTIPRWVLSGLRSRATRSSIPRSWCSLIRTRSIRPCHR